MLTRNIGDLSILFSVYETALGKQRLAIRRMELGISMIISLTISLLFASMRIRASVTASAAIPFNISMIVPFPPCPLFVILSAPSDSQVHTFVAKREVTDGDVSHRSLD